MKSQAGPRAGGKWCSIGCAVGRGQRVAVGQWGGARAFLDHEFVVLMGDLNYRLGMPDEDARAALRRGDLQALRAADELTNMRHSGARSGLHKLAPCCSSFVSRSAVQAPVLLQEYNVMFALCMIAISVGYRAYRRGWEPGRDSQGHLAICLL